MYNINACQKLVCPESQNYIYIFNSESIIIILENITSSVHWTVSLNKNLLLKGFYFLRMPLYFIHISAPTGVQFLNCIYKPSYVRYALHNYKRRPKFHRYLNGAIISSSILFIFIIKQYSN